MFEARLLEGVVLKKVLDAVKDLLQEAIFDCSDAGIQVNFVMKHFSYFTCIYCYFLKTINISFIIIEFYSFENIE